MSKYGPTSWVSVSKKGLMPSLHALALKDGHLRLMPAKENKCGEAICKFIRLRFEGVHHSYYIGTPTICAVNERFKMLYFDNLFVAQAIAEVTSSKGKYTIVVGNYVNQEEAEKKAENWRGTKLQHSFTVRIGQVDAITFKREVKKICEATQNIPNSQILIVFMTGGNWNQRRCRHGLHLNYRDVIEWLTFKYPHLHIIATAIKFVGMNAFYVNKGCYEMLTNSGNTDWIWEGTKLTKRRNECLENQEITSLKKEKLLERIPDTTTRGFTYTKSNRDVERRRMLKECITI